MVYADWAILYSLKHLCIAEAQKIQHAQIIMRGVYRVHCNKTMKNNSKFMNNKNLIQVSKNTAALATIN